MSPTRAAICLGAVVGLAVGCSDGIPTASDPGLIPIDAETFIVELPFEAFASGFRVDGGYGSPADLVTAAIARADEGGGESRPLVQWGALPGALNVPQADGSPSVQDSTWTVVGGELVLRVDSARFRGGELFEIEAQRVIEPFDVRTASWTMSVDTLGERRSWSTPGGGEREVLGSVLWAPGAGDSLVFALDSAMANRLGDREALNRAILVRTTTDGAFLRLFDARLRLQVRPASRPDTVLVLQPTGEVNTTFIHPGDPIVQPGLMAAGGAPAFRTSFRLGLPDQVTATGTVCGGAPSCLIDLTADRLIFAGLVLTTAPPSSSLYQPADTISVELRPVLAPDLLPRSPLGVPVQMQPRRVPPSAFEGAAGTRIEVPLTRFVRDFIRGPGPGQDPIPSTLSLLSGPEPFGLGVATFEGPGSAGAPRLRLILTRSDGVSLP
ncbi:hypothetical protein BH23GEM11_BH23GEM11_11160 [soil metagenome]